jgi:mitochondrial fission protein ELM1
VVSDGTPGMENQCVGLAAAVGLAFTVKRVTPRLPWRWLPPRACPTGAALAAAALAPPWPRLLIASGRQSIAPSLAVARASIATFTVQIQDPHLDPARFGLVVAPAHDRLTGANVVATLGSLHGVTAATLAAARAAAPSLGDLPRPRIAVLVGGANRVYRFGAAEAAALGTRVAALARAAGGSLLITPSRRTGQAAAAAIAAAVQGVPGALWDGTAPNPYLAYLAWADAIVVTADSVNMTTEALATGAPVHVAGLPGGSAKFRRFHEALATAGYTRPLGAALETWNYPPLDETGRVAALVRQRLGVALSASAG